MSNVMQKLRKKQIILIVLTIMFLVLTSSLVSGSTGRNVSPIKQNGLVSSNIAAINITASPIKEGSGKIESSLYQMYQKQKSSEKSQTSAIELNAQENKVQVARVQVTIGLKYNINQTQAIAKIKALGAHIQTTFKSPITHQNLVQAMIPVSQLSAIADLSFVKVVRLPNKPVLSRIYDQGTDVIKSTLANAAGYTGKGIKVAVIGFGFNLSNPEISGNIVENKSFILPNGTITGESSRHGTATAEIVVDVAPNVSLYLYNFNTEVEWDNAVNYSISQGVNIISSSIGWFNQGNYDGTSPIDEMVDYARQKGILWVNSAGNEAQRHWDGNFTPATNSNYSRWNTFIPNSTDRFNEINFTAGSPIEIYLSWNDWTSYPNYPNQDLDLYLLNSTGYIVAESINTQNGNVSSGYPYPTEFIPYVPTYTGPYYIGIYNYNTTRNVHIQLFIGTETDYKLEYDVANNSLINPADANGSLTVGATYWADGVLERFSSQGPTTDGRTKPDVVAPDGVSSSIYGISTGNHSADWANGVGFFGTSASAPNVAGAAALLLEQNQSRSPDQLQTLLENSAVHLGVKGKNNQTGYGIIDVYAALNLSSYPGGSTRIGTCTNIDTPGTYILNTNLTDGSVTGCINITANNVIFDGAGHTISSINANNIAGVYVYNSTKTLTNVTVKNLVATDWSIGIFYNNSKSGSIENNTALNNDFGIFLDTSSSNTLKNNNVSDNPYGVVFVNSSNNDLTNNIATLNNVIGIFLFNSSNNDLTNNIANSNNVGGIILFNSSNYNTLTNNTANLNNISGIFLDSYNNNNDLTNNIANSNNVGGIILFNSSNYNTLTNNTANLNNLSGIFLDTSSNYDTLTNNTASSNKQYGIYLNVSSSNTLTSNILTSNLDGIRLDTSNSNVITGDIVTGHTTGTGIWQKNSNNNTLTNNNVSNNKWGIYFENSTNATITSNIAWNNSQYGIDLETSSNNTLSNNTLHDNGWDFNSLSSSSNTIIANSFNNTKASFTYSGDIKVKSSTSPVSSPIGYTSVGKYLNITTITSGWVYLNVSYNNSDVAGLNKSSLLMWRYNGSEWSQVSGTNGINAAQNYVYANFTVSGVGRNIVVTYGSDNLNEVTPAVKDVWVSGNGTELNPSYPTVLPLDSTHNGQIAYIGNGSSIMYDANGNGEVSDSVDYPLYDGVYVLNHVTGVVRFVYDISHHMVSDYTTGSPAFFPGDVAKVRGNKYGITDVSNFAAGKVKLGSAITKKITYTPGTTLSPDRSVVLTGNYKAFYTVNSTLSTGTLYFYNNNSFLGTYSFTIGNGGNAADTTYASATVNGSVVIGGSATDKINSISALNDTGFKANYDIYLVKLSNSTVSNPWVSMVLVDKNTINTVSDGQSGAMGYGVVWVDNTNAPGKMLLMSNPVQLVLGSSVVVPGTENLYKAKYSILQGLDIKFQKTYIQPNGAEWNTSQYNFLTHNIHIKTSDGNVVVTYGSDNLNEGQVAKDVWVSGNGTELNPTDPTTLLLDNMVNGKIAYIGNDSSIMYDANGNGRVSDSVDYPLYDGVYVLNHVTGVVRFVYDISHHMVYDYTTGSAAFFPGDVANVRGNNYAITDVSNFAAGNVSLGSAITKKITYTPGTTVSSGNATVLTGNYKVFYYTTNTTGILYFYDGNSLIGTYILAINDGGNGAYASANVSGSTSVVIGGSATDKINSISALNNTSLKANYDIYLVKLSNSTASNPWVSMVLVDKNTVNTVSDGQNGAMGYGVSWVDNTNALGKMLLMSNPVQLVLGSSVVVPGTENLYKAKYSILQGLDIKFMKTDSQPSGAEWDVSQYSDFLSQDLKILGSIAAISVFAPMGTTPPPPEVNIISPANTTYSTTLIPLNYTSSDTNLQTTWYQYNSTNTTLTGNITFTALDNKESTLILWANDTAGNINSTAVTFTVDTIPPSVNLISPANTTYSTTLIPLNYTSSDTNLQTTWYQYNSTNTTLTGNTNFTALDNKESTLILWANDTAGNINSTAVTFTVDTTPPKVTIISPLNITYNTSSVILNLSRSDNFGVNTTLYSVDGAANLTYSTPTTVTGLVNGTHNIVVFTNDSAGNVNITSVFFSLDNIINESVNNIVANASNKNNQTNVSTPDIFLNISTVHALVGKVNVTVYSATPPGVNTSLKVARYVEINVTDNMNDTSGNLSWVYLRENYTSQEVSGLEKSTLRLYWWNPHVDNWTRLVKGMNLTAYDGPYVYGAGVNTNANYVWANLSHFSTYGISGSVLPTIISSPSTGGGGGGGGAAPVKPAPIKKSVRMINVTSGGVAALVGKFLYFKKEFFVAPSELAGVMGSMGYFPTSAGMVDKLDKELASPVKIIRGDPYIIASKDVLQKYPWAYRVVIARGDLGVDSIAAVAYARALNAPILLVKPGKLPSVTENALTKLNTKYTIIIGGPVAVDNAVAAKLPREVRIGGMDRYGTAVKIAEAFETVHTLNTIIITNGLKPDLTAVMLAEYYQAPIIYVKGNVVPEVTKDYLLQHKVNILTVGVSEKAVNTIKELINQ